jgi:hypothetical protein
MATFDSGALREFVARLMGVSAGSLVRLIRPIEKAPARKRFVIAEAPLMNGD